MQTLTRRAIAGLFLGLTLFAAAPRARAQETPVFDYSNWIENIVAAANSIRAVLNQITQIRAAIAQIQLQLVALQKLGEPNWRNLGDYLTVIENILNRGEALTALALGMDELFQQTFPGFEIPDDPLLPANTQAKIMSGLETARSALHTARAHYAQLREAQVELGRIKASLAGITGHQEALESIAMVTTYAAEETMLLRHALLTSQTMEAGALARDYDEHAEQIVLRGRLFAGIAPLAASCGAGYSIRDLVGYGSRFSGCPPLPPGEAPPAGDYPAYTTYGTAILPDYPPVDYGEWPDSTFEIGPIDLDLVFVPPYDEPPPPLPIDDPPADSLPAAFHILLQHLHRR